jgi:hypothetical protein
MPLTKRYSAGFPGPVHGGRKRRRLLDRFLQEHW